MYCLKPFLINNDLLFSFVSNKNGVAVKPSRVLLMSYCNLPGDLDRCAQRTMGQCYFQ